MYLLALVRSRKAESCQSRLKWCPCAVSFLQRSSLLKPPRLRLASRSPRAPEPPVAAAPVAAVGAVEVFFSPGPSRLPCLGADLSTALAGGSGSRSESYSGSFPVLGKLELFAVSIRPSYPVAHTCSGCTELAGFVIAQSFESCHSLPCCSRPPWRRRTGLPVKALPILDSIWEKWRANGSTVILSKLTRTMIESRGGW